MTVPKVGPDYSRVLSTLAQSKTQSENPALYQSLRSLVTGARDFQGFIEGRYNSLNSNFSDITLTIEQILEELAERNSTKYSVSVTNSATQSLADSTSQLCTFDTTIFDDGLMLENTNNIRIHANAQWDIRGRVLFAAGTSSIRRISVHLNGKRQFSTQFSALEQKVIVPFTGLIEALVDDVITIYAYQESGSALNIIPSLQMYRATYVNRGAGRNLIEGTDGTTGDGGGGGGGGGGTCTGSTPGPGPEVPTWFVNLLTANGATNCYDPAILAAMEASLNALSYYLQYDSGHAIRGRLYYPTPTSYDHPIDLPRNDGGWTWYQW